MAELNEKDVSFTEFTDERNNETTGISELHSGIPISIIVCQLWYFSFCACKFKISRNINVCFMMTACSKVM